MFTGEGEDGNGGGTLDSAFEYLSGNTEEIVVPEPPAEPEGGEPVVVDPPVVEGGEADDPQVVDPPAEPTPFDFTALGLANVTNEVEYQAFDLPSRLKRLQDLEAQLPVLEDRVKKAANPFANESIAKYNESLKNGSTLGIELFNEVDSLDPATISDDPIGAMVLKAIIKTPKLAARRSEVREALEKKYGINREKWEEQDDEYKPSASEIDLITDSQSSVDFLMEEKSKIKPYEATAPTDVSEEAKQRLALLEESKAKWDGIANNMVAKVKVLPVVRGENGFNVPVDQKWLADNKDQIRDLAINSNLELNAEGVNTLTDIVANMYFISNKTAVLEEYGKKLETEWRKATDAGRNGAPPLDTIKGDKGGSKTSKEDELDAYLNS